MSKRIRCLWHEDKTASLVVYQDGYKCYGCGKKGELSELGPLGGPVSTDLWEKLPPVSIDEEISRISQLPTVKHRGLSFPADENGYYIVWPGREYFKKRFFDPGPGPKYLNPRGVKQPLFWATPEGGSDTLFIVEGEINALSLAQAFPGESVCSPGSTTNFTAEKLRSHLPSFRMYGNIIVVMDTDNAAISAIIRTKGFFLDQLPFVSYLQIEPDANEILCTHGKEKLKEAIETGLSSGMPRPYYQ